MAGGNILRRIPSLTPSEFPNSMPSQHSHGPRFIDSIRAAGIRPDDSDEVKLAKSLLVFATGLGSITSILWLLLYWTLGPKLSSSFPFAFQLLLAGNLLLYIRSGNFDLFRYTQLGLFLFAPFAVQWSMGNIITASGIVLWGLLAPIGALMIFGARQSLAWFIAWLLLVFAEQINATSGIGYMMTRAQIFNQTDVIVVGLVTYAVLGLLSDSLVRFLERRLLRWQPGR